MRVVFKTFQTAGRALRRNVMRSALTCVGIVIGIAAVIAMMEIGNGIAELNQRTIASLGANALMVQPGTAASGGLSFGAGSTLTLTPQDCDAILRDCPAVRGAAPQVGTNGQLVYGHTNWVPMQITGTTPQYLDVRQWPVTTGECFSDQDVRNSSKVCVVGQTIVQKLFDGESPIGRELRLANVSLRVVGVLDRKGANMFGRDQDDIVLLPWTTLKYRISNKTSGVSQAAASAAASTAVNSLSNLYPTSGLTLYPAESEVQAADTPKPVRFTNINSIMTAAATAADIPVAITEITELLRDRHHIRADQPDDFDIRDMTDVLKTLSASTDLIANLLLIVAMISLVVGGVGIMNIMLVSVTERTREIGLRMAVGARARDILRQFLVEAIVLCLIGGVVGILIGRGASLLVRAFLHWPTAISYPAIFASVLVSATVGVVFGYYPAWKASRLDPIEALRYE